MGILKFAWCLISIGVLVGSLALYDPVTGHDGDLILVYGMLILAFPSGFLVAGAIALGSYTMDTLEIHFLSGLIYGRLSIVLMWMALVVVGYVQWFLLLPAFVLRLRSQQRRASAGDR